MRQSARSARSARRIVAATLALLAGSAVVLGARTVLLANDLAPATASAQAGVVVAADGGFATAPVVESPPAPAFESPLAPAFATGNPQLDALLGTLPPVLFEGGAQVHFGYNPIDCCHAGGYNPEPNEVWVSERALRSTEALVYVTAHELAHSVHLRSARGAELTAAVTGAPAVRAGSPWDDSEKVADCVAWVLFPLETAAGGITYWSCPDPWRDQVRAALE